jgi:hypothetical protein
LDIWKIAEIGKGSWSFLTSSEKAYTDNASFALSGWLVRSCFARFADVDLLGDCDEMDWKKDFRS